MADAITIARPYARAVFEVAVAENRLEQWGDLLKGLGQVLADSNVDAVLHDPQLGSDRIAGAIFDALSGRLDGQGQNFIRLLAEYGRLDVLPEISARFDALRAEAERTVDVDVASAAPLSEEYKQQLAGSLRQRLGREVRLHCRIDESLIGGALIRAGDLVIDGSLRGRLDQLTTVVKT